MSKYTLVILLSLVLLGCTEQQQNASPQSYTLGGKTMGTTYSIQFIHTDQHFPKEKLQKQLDQALLDINQAASTYIPESTISQFNKGKQLSLDSLTDRHFIQNYLLARQIYQRSNKWFNPCVMPLVNYWGFGYTEKKAVNQIDSSLVDSLVQLVDFEQVQLQREQGKYILSSKRPGLQLDFSAIAKGYAVDELAKILEQNNIAHYLVEIGGELLAKGYVHEQQAWRVGIRVPDEKASRTALQTAIQLPDLALATSGNYENYYEVNGEKYAHTINPMTGYPEKNQLLSASVVADNCATADAFATAFMSMGLERARKLNAENNDIHCLFIYSNAQGEIEMQADSFIQELLPK